MFCPFPPYLIVAGASTFHAPAWSPALVSSVLVLSESPRPAWIASSGTLLWVATLVTNSILDAEGSIVITLNGAEDRAVRVSV